MKKLYTFLFASILAFWLIVGCNSQDDTIVMMDDDVSQTDDDPTPNDDDTEGSTMEYEMVDLQVILPNGTDLDLSAALLMALGESYDVNADGTAQVEIVKESKTFVYLTNSENKMLFMGFVSANRPKLTITSVLEASLYFSLGTVFQFNEVKDRYLNEFQDLPEIQHYVDEFSEMYKNDPLVLNSEMFISWLSDTMSELTTKKNIDLGASVLVTNGDIQSGLKVVQDDNDIFSVNVLNYWRRRAHAFVYKVATKKEDSKDFVTINGMDIIGDGNEKADYEIPVSAISGVTSIIGNAVDIGFSNGQNVAITTNGPQQLELSDDDSAAKYEVRVVGVGKDENLLMTPDEISMARTLALQTVLFDFLIPVVTNAVGIKDIKDVGSAFEISEGIEIVNALLASTPNATDAFNKGDIKTAAIEIIKALATNYVGTESFWEYMLKGLKAIGFNNLNKYGIQDLAAKTVAPLTIANSILTIADIARVFHTLSADKLEVFGTVVSRGKVKINPAEKGLALGDEVLLTAKVLDDEEILEGEYNYQWSTSGTYGSFKVPSNSDQITYLSDPKYNPLPSDARESIYVDVFKDNNLVGRDSAFININAAKYRIRPNGITIKGDNNITLRIVDVDNKPLENNVLHHFKIVWSTEGKYGKLNGSNNVVTTLLSEEKSVDYHSLDTEVESATEKITARIYYTRKGPDDPSVDILIQEVEAEINIKNDDLILIYYADIGVGTRPPEYDGLYYNYGVWNTWRWNPSEADVPEGYEIERIYMKVMERTPDGIPSCTLNSGTWYPGNEEEDLVDGSYEVTCFYSGGSALTSSDANSAFASLLAYYQSIKGYAQVTVYLKPKS